ncbi:hypothetical protein ABPG75_005851 [Micractinium tetrahymenae]
MPKPKAAGAKAPQPAQEQEAAPAPDSQPADAGAGGPPAKKKRNNNPGVRVQGGRVYDSEKGTTCHQCRQKTVEVKAKCTACTLYFCPKCLENRYKELVESANAAGDWRCPRCRGECNCSNCRKKQGMQATGQLANIAKKAGFGSVRDLLERNPNAKAIQLPRAPSGGAAADGEAGEAAGEGGPASKQAGVPGAARKRAPRRKPSTAAAAEQELIDDEALPPREQPMPEAHPLAVHKAAAVAGSRRQRGVGAWAANVAEVTALPEGQAGAELAAVLEFLQVFGPKLQLRAPCLAALAAELLQPAAAGGQGQLLCPREEESAVGAVHCCLLELVRAYWNVKGAVGASAWQGIMKAYYAASLLTGRQALNLRWQHGPPAVAGEIFTRPAGGSQAEGEEEEAAAAPSAGEAGEEAMEVDCGAAGAAAAALGVGSATAVDYPGGSYWGLPAEARIGMLHALVNDALECGELRQLIEGSMGDAMDEEKERRQQLAGVRKEAREAIARERDQQIAMMIASADGGLTLEQQQKLLEEARQRAEAAASSAAAAKVKALTEKVHPPTVRAAVVGCDREGRRYLQLQVAPLLTGEGGLVVQCGGAEGPCSTANAAAGGSSSSEALTCYPSSRVVDVAAALHPKGRREGPLQAALVHAFKLPADALPAPASQAAGGSQPAAETAAEQKQQQQQEEPAGGKAPAVATAGGGLGKAQHGKKQAGGKSKSASPAAAVAAPPAEAADAAPGAAAGAPAQKGRKRAASRGQSGSPGGAAPEAGSADGVAAGGEAPAGKRRRQASEAGSSAERAVPRRQRSAPAPVPAAAEAAPKPARRRGGRAASKAAHEAAAAGDAVLPLKVDDILPVQ